MRQQLEAQGQFTNLRKEKMNHQTDCTPYEGILQLINQHGFNEIKNSLEKLFNEAMKYERSQALKAEKYERTSKRNGYANGYKDKKLKTRVGELNLKIPQTRDSSFYPSALEKGARSERALMLTLAEMYVNGVSTRKVSGILETMCGTEISSTTVSRVSAEMDEELGQWRNRELGRIPFLILDARYENVRHGGSIVRCAILVAIGIRPDGRRSVLGVSVSLSEAEVHWREFLLSLKKRGMHGVEMISSDDHKGIKAALRTTMPSVKWNRCQFHLQQNAGHYVPKMSMKKEVAEDIRAIFNAANRNEADRLLDLAVKKYEVIAPKLSQWMEGNISEGLTCFDIPPKFRRRLRTTNMLERLNQEIKRRTRVANMFPNEDSALRLISAVLMEVSDNWETGRIYLTIEDTSFDKAA